jgi:hypothetical protein
MADDNVETLAQSALEDSGYEFARRVECVYRDGVLTLHGAVSSYYHKQIAQTLVRSCADPMVIDNQLTVLSVCSSRN